MIMGNAASKLQHILETTFDIPFDVEYGIDNGDPWYKIRPAGYINETFEIKLFFLNQLRLIMEFLPDVYAAPLINDMANSSPAKRAIFLGYAKVLLERRAKINFRINNIDVSVSGDSDWPQDWKKIELKITKSPIVEEDEKFIPDMKIVDWGCIFVGMVLSLLEITPIDNGMESFAAENEGAGYKAVTGRYERSLVNRNLCIAAKGYSCRVCGIDFQSSYGDLGSGFIHVHHIIPVSKMGPNYAVNPLNDLEPVCPNCHSMLHRKDPPLEIEELKTIITKKTPNQSS